MGRGFLNREQSAKLAARVAHKYKNDFKGDKKKTWLFFKREGFKWSTINNWIKKIDEQGSCKIKIQRGRVPKIKTPENMRRMAEILKDNPSISGSKLARRMNLGPATVRKILSNEFRNGIGIQEGGSVSEVKDAKSHLQPRPLNGPSPTLVSHLPPASPFADVDLDLDDCGSQAEGESSRCVRSCFLCNVENAVELDFDVSPGPLAPEELGPAEVNKSLKVVCFLSNVLGMKRDDIAVLLEETGGMSPGEWGISLCTDPGCKGPVQRAFDIWMEMKKLEVELRKKREAIRERLKSCRVREEIEDDQVFLRERVREVIKEAKSQKNATDPLESQVKMEIEVDNLSNAEVIGDHDNTGWDGNLDDHFQELEIKVESSCENLRRRSSRSERSITKFKPDASFPKKSCQGRPRKRKKNGMNSKLQKMKSKPEGHLVSGGSDEMIYSCHLCPSLGNMDIDKFIAHIAFHSMHPKKCTECSSHFLDGVSMEEVQNHWKERHPYSDSTAPKVTQVSAVDAAGKIWLCSRPKCKAPFQSAEERNSHELTVHHVTGPPKVSCQICPSKFHSVTEVRLHKALEHPEDAAVSCSYCDTKLAIQSEKDSVKFLNLDELKKHISEAHADRRSTGEGKKLPRFLQTCHVCGLVLQGSYYFKLDSHIAQEHGQKLHETYTCPICQKKMRNGDAWKHTIRHWPDAPRKYVCQFCGKGFVRQETRLNHEKIHKNQITRPFQCEFCPSSFAVSNYLYTHRRVTHQRHIWPSVLRKRKQAARNKVIPNSIGNFETGLKPDQSKNLELQLEDSSFQK